MMRLVLVKQSSHRRQFFRNAKDNEDCWLFNVAQAVAPNTSKIEEAVLWLLYWYGRRFRNVFILACEKLHVRVVLHVMDPETSQCCWQYSGVSDTQVKRLLRFFSFIFYWRFTCSVKKQHELLPTAVPQVTGEFIDIRDNKKTLLH